MPSLALTPIDFPADDIYHDADTRAKGYVKLKSKGRKFNPPIHKGCVCHIVPELETRVKKPKWKPTMTKVEAEVWAKDSVEKRIFHHGTDYGDDIMKSGFKAHDGAYGRGVYMTTSDMDAAVYGLDVLDLKVNLRNPIIGKSAADVGRLMGELEKKFLATGAKYSSDSFADWLIKEGYDGIRMQRQEGMDWLIVLDPKNITIVEG